MSGQDYGGMVHRLRELVATHVPAGATVAVVSKGDPELIRFDGRQGWHYPQTADGIYLGHNPATGTDAVTHLESLRQRGATYLVLPATAGWWLQHYADFRGHLESEAHVVHQDDSGTIYRLGQAEASALPVSAATHLQLRDLVSALLPDDCIMVALDWAATALRGSGEMQVLAPPAQPTPTRRIAPAAVIAAMKEAGGEYLVVPATRRLPAAAADMARYARDSYPLVVEQRHVCAVFDLAERSNLAVAQ